MDKETRILILEDTAADAELFERELRRGNIAFTSRRVDTEQAFIKTLAEFEPHIVLSDYQLPQFSGMEALHLLKQRDIDIPFLLITGALTEEIAALCIKEGVTDYLLKSNLTRLPSAVATALKQSEIEKEKAEALTALHESQEQLRQSQKLEGLGQLAGGIAHDFNNLLTVINGFTSLAMKHLPPDSLIRSNLEEVKKAGERASALTRQLLAFSRKQILQPEVLNLDSVITDMEKMLRRVLPENIDLRVVLEPKLGSVKADPGQIEQILLNLVINARDSMPAGGNITIATDNIYLDEIYASNHVGTEPGHFVMLAVSDTGTGMDEATIARIFEPFFTTKELGKGTGLGLSTTYGIVKQSGGNIWVYSEVGQGSMFKIYLPRVTEEPREHQYSIINSDELGGTGTVLLVEDEEMVRRLANQILLEGGYEVFEAQDGAEAIALSKQYRGSIDLLLTDVVIPGMSGRELATRLRHERPQMKILFMSGYTNDAIVHHGVLESGTNFIQKPFAPETLAMKVRNVLEQNGLG